MVAIGSSSNGRVAHPITAPHHVVGGVSARVTHGRWSGGEKMVVVAVSNSRVPICRMAHSPPDETRSHSLAVVRYVVNELHGWLGRSVSSH